MIHFCEITAVNNRKKYMPLKVSQYILYVKCTFNQHEQFNFTASSFIFIRLDSPFKFEQ